ncbi:MAG TPA: glutamyl-tRNA reductase [bacterium]|nr:glutamyl-tRNA reductase [bacterium]
MQIVVHGLNHRTAPLDVREKVAFHPDELAGALAELRGDDIGELTVLSTCNRTEFYAVASDPEAAVRKQQDLVRRTKSVDLGEPGLTYVRIQRDSVEHLFRVASGLDSMVLGEAAILGQVKTAYEAATAGDAVGPIFSRLFDAALHVGKRSRTETEIGRGASSLEKSSVQLAQKVFGDLGTRTALVVGAGDSGERVATLLRENGIGRVRFANRTRSKAEELAALHGGTVADFADLEAAVADTDIVVTAVSTRDPVVSADAVKRATDGRRRGPLLVLDLGVPRNVERAVAKIQSVFLYSVDDLQELVELNLGKRRREIPAVEAIVAEETARFEKWMLSLQTTPVVVALRDEGERIRRETLERFGKGLSAEERALLERFSDGLVKKLMHGPTVAVRSCDPQTYEGLRGLHWAQRMFGLDGEDGPGHHRRRGEKR